MRTYVALGVLSAALLCLPTTTSWSTEKTKVTGLYAPAVDVYSDPKSTKKVGQIHSSDVSKPLEVLEISPNLMLRIDTGKVKGWIRSTMVKTEGEMFDAADVGPCNYAGADETGGASRGIGNNCKAPE
jgi:hypothetical protein